MGNDGDEFKGLDGVGVLQVEQKNEDVDVNENIESLENEKKSIEGNFGNGEVDEVGLTKNGELCVGEVNFEVGVVDDSLKTPLPRKRGRPRKNKGGGSSNSEVEGDVDMKTGISQRTRNRFVKGRKEGGDGDDMVGVEMNGVEVDDKGVKENGFAVGNFVWGKIKSHPWWPGRVYPPSCASDFALKCKHEGRVLVACFGDGTFAWCDPSQLKPFELNFEEMSRQSRLKSFASAVEEAVEEYGNVVEGNMTCAIKGSQRSRPLVVNAGIKEGVHVPLDGVEGFSVDKFESTKVLDNIRSFARFEFAVNLLEIRMLRSLLSVYYHSKGMSLPTYHEPMGIEQVSTHGPGDGDWLLGPGDQALMQNEMETSKKVKAMTDLLGTNTELEENNADGSKGEMQPHLLASRSGRKRKVANDSDETGTTPKEDDRLGNLVSKSGRRGQKKTDENQSPSADNAKITRSSARKGRESEKGDKKTVKSPRNREMSVGIRIDHVLTSEQGQDQRMSPREKKRSKYLSPPYTSLSDQKLRNSDMEFSDVTKMGEKMSKVTGNLVGSAHGKTEADHSDHQTHKLRSNVDDSVKIIGSPNDVLCEIRSAALNPICLKTKDESFDTIKGFLCSYRDANFIDGSHDQSPKKQTDDKRKRERKTTETRNGSDGNVGAAVSENKKRSKSRSTQKLKSNDKHTCGVTEDEPLTVVVIKKKLEAMTSMLRQADGKMTEEVKTNLENDAKELLKKVKMMKTSSPSS